MPRYALPPPHRIYRNNITRKGALETELLWESEAVPITGKEEIYMPRSPVSVQDVYIPEIQPLNLPDSWTVVGKKGKPLKGKMYDEPQLPKKKKKKNRKPKAETTLDPLVDLEETPSSSKCHNMSDRSNSKRFKEVSRARDAKHWARYRENKQIQADALVALHALLLADEHDSTHADREEGKLPARLETMLEQTSSARRKSEKSSSHKQKVRRANRFSAAAARCYAFEDNDYAHVVINASAKQKMQALGAGVDDSKKRRSASRKHACIAKEKSTDKRKATEVDAEPQAKASSSKAAKNCSIM